MKHFSPYETLRRIAAMTVFLLLYSFGQAQSLVRMEYFLDKDPGAGKGDTVNFSGPRDTILKTINIPIGGIKTGQHFVYVRILDSGELWSPWQMQLFFVQDTIDIGPVQQLEYFTGKDPGVAKATRQTITARDTVSSEIRQATGVLKSGQNFMYVRAKTANGFWSPWQMQLFFIQDTIDIGPVQQLEYFTGKDPGVAKATRQTIIARDTVSSEISQATGTLKPGQNFMHVRAKVANGYWSPWQIQMFLVEDTSEVGKITQVEYFLGKEPGPGKAIAHTITAGDTVKTEISRSTASLGVGMHYVHVRAKLAYGNWSPWQFQMILVQDTIQPGPIQQLEYFVNKDPGPGKGIQVTISAADTLKRTFGHNTAGLSRGQHFMHVRCRNSTGLWSPWQFQMFLVETPADTGKIISYKYSIDSSLMRPARVKTSLVSPPSDSLKKTHLEKTDTALRFGRHFFRIWAQQNNRLSSTWHFDTFDVIDCPMLDTAAVIRSGRVCIGDTLRFRQDITKFGVWSRDSFNFTWKVNGTTRSTADTLKYRHNGSDTFRLEFSYARKRDARCKGILSQSVKLFKVPRDTFRSAICSGDSLRIHGAYRKTTGTFNFNGTTSVGCDSFSTVILTVNPFYRDTFSREICSGDSLRIHGIFRKTAGNYVLNGKTAKGCDSVVTVVLKVNQVYRKTDTAAICKGDTLKIHGRRYTVPGTYRDSFKTSKGCDSLFTTRVIVNPTYDDSSSRSICSGDSSLIHGIWRKTAGSYRLSGTTTKGCDSFSTVILTVNPVYRDTLNREICSGDSLRVHGTFRNAAGNYVLNGKTAKGCDSVVTVVLKVNPVYRKTDTIAFCKGDTLKIHGKRYTAAGTYRDSFKTRKGCDSLFTTRVIVNPTYDDSSSRSICAGDSSRIHGIWRKTAGSYRLSGTTTKGCDSFFTVQLIVKPVYNYSLAPEICAGDSINIHGVFRKAAGIYVLNGKTRLGCDSIVTTILKVNPVYHKAETIEICGGDTLKIHGKRYTSAGTYRDSFKTFKGCDSLFTTRLIVHPAFKLTQNRGLCGGDSFFFAGAWRKVTGQYVGRFTTIRGCDSTVTLNLTVDSIIRSDDFPRICFGDSMLIGGRWRKTAGTYTDIYKAFKGCDSAVTRHLTIIPRDTTYQTVTICQRGSLNFHGQILSDTGTYKAILKNRLGCDSVLFMRIFKRAENRTVLSGTVCFGEGFFAGNGLKFGSGTFFDTLTGSFGCDSVVIYTQTERPRDTFAAAFSICAGDSVFSGKSWKRTAGKYREILKNRFGCDSVLTTTIAVRPVSFTAIRDTICFGSAYNFLGTTLTAPGIYRKVLVNHVGCDSVLELDLFRRAQFIPKVVASGFARLTTDKPYATYQWYLNRLIFSGETGRSIAVAGNGIYDVAVTDSLGCGANSWDDLLNTGSGFDENLILLYPNPVSDAFTVKTPQELDMRVYNSAGKLIRQGRIMPGEQQMRVTDWSEGLYQVVLRHDKYLYSAKLVVVH